MCYVVAHLITCECVKIHTRINTLIETIQKIRCSILNKIYSDNVLIFLSIFLFINDVISSLYENE